MSSIKKFIPLLDRILVEKISAGNQTTSGGILLPSSSKSSPQQAKVIAVGTGLYKADGTFTGTIVKQGDTVILNSSSKMQHTPVPMNDKTYYLLSESDILGIVDP